MTYQRPLHVRAPLPTSAVRPATHGCRHQGNEIEAVYGSLLGPRRHSIRLRNTNYVLGAHNVDADRRPRMGVRMRISRMGLATAAIR